MLSAHHQALLQPGVKEGLEEQFQLVEEILLELPGADIGIVQGGKWEAHTPLGAEYSEYPLWVP